MNAVQKSPLKRFGFLILFAAMTFIEDCRPQLMTGTKNADVQRSASGGAKCRECSPTQVDNFRPLCGSDGRTYANECELKKINCEGQSVQLRHEGKCSVSAPTGGRCHTQRAEAEKKLKLTNSKFSSSEVIHVPHCQKDGRYSEVQCHANTNYCWCVDSISGQPIPGSSTVKWRRPKCNGTGNRSHQLQTRDGPKVTLKRGSAVKKRPVKQGCRKSEQMFFNRNLVKYFVNEYNQQEQESSAGDNRPVAEAESVEKKAVEWKFSEFDKNKNNWLEKKEVKSLRRIVRKFVKPTECAKRFTTVCDADRNRKISHGEWIVCLGVGMNKEQTDVSGLMNPRSEPSMHDHDGGSLNSRWDKELRTQVDDKSLGLDEEDPLDCYTERQNALEQQRNSQHTIYVPECGPDRKYAQIQCYKSTGYCWCVDRDSGKPIPSTSVRNTKPDCEKLIKADKQIKGCPNRKKSEFIGEFIDYLIKEMSSDVNRTDNFNDNLQIANREQNIEILSKWKFEKLDANFNRILDKNEWREFRKALKKKKSMRKCGRSFIKFCDGNNDKSITYEEWTECFSILKDNKSGSSNRRQKGQNPLDKYLKND